jgi:hypothetical protein
LFAIEPFGVARLSQQVLEGMRRRARAQQDDTGGQRPPLAAPGERDRDARQAHARVGNRIHDQRDDPDLFVKAIGREPGESVHDRRVAIVGGLDSEREHADHDDAERAAGGRHQSDGPAPVGRR